MDLLRNEQLDKMWQPNFPSQAVWGSVSPAGPLGLSYHPAASHKEDRIQPSPTSAASGFHQASPPIDVSHHHSRSSIDGLGVSLQQSVEQRVPDLDAHHQLQMYAAAHGSLAGSPGRDLYLPGLNGFTNLTASANPGLALAGDVAGFTAELLALQNLHRQALQGSLPSEAAGLFPSSASAAGLALELGFSRPGLQTGHFQTGPVHSTSPGPKPSLPSLAEYGHPLAQPRSAAAGPVFPLQLMSGGGYAPGLPPVQSHGVDALAHLPSHAGISALQPHRHQHHHATEAAWSQLASQESSVDNTIAREAALDSGAPIPIGLSRRECLARFREKKARRSFNKRVLYEMRKVNADKRPRIKGRFVTHAELQGYKQQNEGVAADGLADDTAEELVSDVATGTGSGAAAEVKLPSVDASADSELDRDGIGFSKEVVAGGAESAVGLHVLSDSAVDVSHLEAGMVC